MHSAVKERFPNDLLAASRIALLRITEINSHGERWPGPGAGRPPGKKMLKTLEKEPAREFVRQYVTEHLEPLLLTQIDNGVG